MEILLAFWVGPFVFGALRHAWLVWGSMSSAGLSDIVRFDQNVKSGARAPVYVGGYCTSTPVVKPEYAHGAVELEIWSMPLWLLRPDALRPRAQTYCHTEIGGLTQDNGGGH